jgi:hypothetical protein
MTSIDEFTKALRKVCTCQKLKFALLLLEYCKIRECYAVANAFTIKNTDTSLDQRLGRFWWSRYVHDRGVAAYTLSRHGVHIGRLKKRK